MAGLEREGGGGGEKREKGRECLLLEPVFLYSSYQFPNWSDNVNFQYMTNHNLVGGGGASQHGPNKTFGQIQYAKPPEHSLPAKQATCITVDSSSFGFNVTFLYMIEVILIF